MKIMAIDPGDVRTGIAVCDKFEILASPVCVIKEHDFNVLVQKIIEQILSLQAEEVVVGYPKNMDGSIGSAAQRSKKLITQLQKYITNIPFILWDERNTTKSAQIFLNKVNKNSYKQKKIIDAVAATIILESYLSYKKRKKDDN